MTLQQIAKEIKRQLASFSAKGAVIDDNTVIGKSLISVQGHDTKKLFKGNVAWGLQRNGHPKKSWPSNFLDLSVADLAQKLLILILVLSCSLASMSQVKFNMSAIQTDLKKAAIQFGFTYLKSLDSSINGQDYMKFGKHSWIMISPEINIQSGTQDALSSLTAKISALAVSFKTITDEEGIVSVDANRVMQTFPLNIGVETNNEFSFINGIAELGWSPWYQSPLSKTPEWLQHTSFGVYAQYGYKWKVKDTTSLALAGGKLDQSAEPLESQIFRLKGTFSVDTRAIIKLAAVKIGLVGTADGWYDIIHNKTYYRLQGIARFYLSDQVYFDADYQKGSGAPNFNKGDQFGVGLTVTF